MSSTSDASEQYIRELIPDLFTHYAERNKWIAEARNHTAGNHKIEVPKDTRFAVKSLNMWTMRSYLNERQARFLQVPRYRVIPPGISETAMSSASDLEKAINGIFYWMRRERDDWGKCISDVMICDGGAMRLESNTKAAWTRLLVGRDGEDDITRGMPTGDESEEARTRANTDRSEARETYKKAKGLSDLFTQTYVPYEAIMGVPDADSFEEYIEYEMRSVRKVIANPNFDKKAIARLKMKMDDGKGSFRAQVPIVRYCNKNTYSYYMIEDISTIEASDQSALARYLSQQSAGSAPDVLHLYSYEHKAGTPLYTHVGGMHGGWGPGDWNYAIGKMKALLALDTNIDELASQMWTMIRETLWPTIVIEYSLERPAEPLADGDPRKIAPSGTRDIELFVGEKIQPFFQPKDNQMAWRMMDSLKESVSKIGGAPGLYGLHQSGVDGGFQENTLLQQADSQFARVEGNIVTAAQNHALTLLSLIRGSGEKVWVRVRKKEDGREYFEDVAIDPKFLDPMPEIDAVVKARISGNEGVQIANYQKATTDVAGPGTAAMTRDMARQELLDVEQPDDVAAALLVQSTVDAILGPILQKEAEREYNLAVAKDVLSTQPVGDPSVMANDPELAAQMGMFAAGQSPPPPPGLLPETNQGMGGGLPYGQPQPAQTLGRTEQLLMAPPPPPPAGM